MKVIDLKIMLEKFDNNMDVMLDITKEGETSFHFVELVSCEDITTEFDQTFVALSAHEYMDDEDEDEGNDLY